jgi:hypothetical protein
MIEAIDKAPTLVDYIRDMERICTHPDEVSEAARLLLAVDGKSAE